MGGLRSVLQKIGLACVVLAGLGSFAGAQPPPPSWPGPDQLPPPNVLPGQGPPGVELSPPAPVPPSPPPGAGPVVGPSSSPFPPPPPGGVIYPYSDPGQNGWGPYGPPAPPPLFYFSWEVGILKPSVKNALSADVPLTGGGTTTVSPPDANLSWTVSPRFEIGYRLPDDQGSFDLGYRFLVAEGTDVLATAPFGTNVKSRLNVNVFDLEYNTPFYKPAVRWDISYTIGARLATAFFDTETQSLLLQQHASSYFVGGGVHLGFEAQREIAVRPGLAFYTRVDGSVLVGQVQQRFTDERATAGGTLTSQLYQRQSQTVPMLQAEAGLSFRPPAMENLRFTCGYQIGQWWNLGRAYDSRLELMTQGLFFRGEINY